MRGEKIAQKKKWGVGGLGRGGGIRWGVGGKEMGALGEEARLKKKTKKLDPKQARSAQ